ncbi:7-deoxyloganetin glucosyltransferase-like [Alnus glutinosa]|uniref:7-deoxyloganetin glucosyltransferase-like n=1 Tax=Alnus glutinosa TaxID=3517 RepID=UPI002D775A6E|nr:7-deoxyloganetin glucosyltransferase-like [Alnus glutinosa]
MDSKTAVADKPHAVCVPGPVQSHIKSMLKISKLLHHRGFHITFVNTEFNHQRLLKSGGPNSLDGLPDFQFRTIPDGLPPSDSNATQDIPSLCDSTMKNFLAPFSDFLVKLNAATSKNPPVTCIIADGFNAFAVTAAQELRVPVVMNYPVSACGVLCNMQFRPLRDRGLTPFKDESYLTNGYLDTVIDWIPGMNNICLRDLPTFIRTTDPNDVLFKFSVDAADTSPKASGVIINTFDAFEQEVLDALSPMFPRLFSIGPLELLLNRLPNDPLKSMEYSLWEEETECIHWLDTKAPNSVLYVNFGSIAAMTKPQLIELSWGLANSKHPFLWIIRPDLVVGESAILPPEFTVETKDRGLIASWCPQEEVLNHPSIGGFLTHCGWNSIAESVSAGVPLLCWPFFADQPMNCKYACNEWGIGMKINDGADREEIGKLVRELLEGDMGKKLKKKALEWKDLAEEATGPNGSSSINLNNLVNEVLLPRG